MPMYCHWLLVTESPGAAVWSVCTSIEIGPSLISADCGRVRNPIKPADQKADDQQNDLGVHGYAASAASFLAFSTACSMVPTI